MPRIHRNSRHHHASTVLAVSIVAAILAGCAHEKAQSDEPDGLSHLGTSAPHGAYPGDAAIDEEEADYDDAAVARQEALAGAPGTLEMERVPAPSRDFNAVVELSPSATRDSAGAPAEESKVASRSSRRKDARGSGRVGGAMKAKRGGGMAVSDEGYGYAPVAPPVAQPEPEWNTEAYDHVAENDFIAVARDPMSTFSIDVDTASYSNVRRFLESGSLPPVDSVRVEELINYFDYAYPQPQGKDPFAVISEVADCPWAPGNRLVHVGLQGKIIEDSKIPPRNLVFLLDVSGSMESPDKLPLVKQGMAMLVEQLRPEDHVSIVVYAGASGVVLEPTSGSDKRTILDSLDRLSAGGSTNGGQGIELAYKLAQSHFDAGAINRVILATDGDFNVGTTSQGDLVRLIEQKREHGVFLSVLGFGSGNLKDATMEQLADKGNGNYAYIDSLAEARKVLVEQAGATLVTIAKDVKIQIEWNPLEVESYRLIGYENRKLAHQDFDDDKKDAGEIGAGHTVTALYEVVPARGAGGEDGANLRYQSGRNTTAAAGSGELMHLKLRFKRPMGADSKLITFAVRDDERTLAQSSDDFRFAAAVAEFGMLLRDSQHRGKASFAQARKLAAGALGHDKGGHRSGFLRMIDMALALKGEPEPAQPVAVRKVADPVEYDPTPLMR
jgi:Ca-activated chloride channel family protein